MIEESDPYDEAIAQALASRSEPGTATMEPEAPVEEDEYDRAIRAALALPEPEAADYAKLGARGLMESVAGPLRGLGGMTGIDAVGDAGEWIREQEPEVNPRAAATLGGQLAEGVGGVAGLIGQSMLVPGSGLVRGAFAAGSMGSSEFGRAEERALAAGASEEDANTAGWASFPAGALQALGPARAVGVLSKAWAPLAKSLGASALKEGGINALTGAVGNAWSESVQNAITGQGDVEDIFRAAKSGLIPDLLIGGALGGAMRWSASRAGPLSPEGLASVDAAAEEAASTMRTSGAPESALQAPGGPVPGVDEASDALSGAPRPTLIEVPDEPLAAATARFQKSIKRAKPVELHEADDATRERAAGIGLRVVEFDAGEGAQADGYYDRESKIAFINRRAGAAERKADLLRHETQHFMEREHPELAARWSKALDEADPKWQAEAGRARRERQKAEGLPGLSEAAGREEARAEAAEGLGSVLELLDTRPDLIAKVADYQPGLIRSLIDASIDLANRLGLTKRRSVASSIAALDAELKRSGSGFEGRLGAQKASRLARELQKLHRAMRVEEPLEQPRANERPSPFLKPEPITEAQGPRAPPVPTRADLVEGLPADRAATALSDLDTRIEEALVRGEGLDTPRLKELAKDRAAAQRLLYEAEPDHPLLGREDPITVWKRIVADDEAAVASARQRQKDEAKAAEQAGLERSKAAQAAARKLERDLAKLEKDASRRQREQMARKSKEDVEFRKLVAEEDAANRRKKAEDDKAKTAAEREAARAEAERLKPPRGEIAADRRARKDELKALRKDIEARLKPTEPAAADPKPKAEKKPAREKDPALADLNRRIAESKAKAEKEPAQAEPKSPLHALGGKRIVHEADGRTFTLDYLPSPTDPKTALVTGLASSGKGTSADAQAGVLAAKLRDAGFTKVDFNRADNEDGRAAARERLFAPIVRALNEKLAEPAKPKLPVARRERIKREELTDPHVRRELERMAQTAGWEAEGGKAFLPQDARNEDGHRGTSKWIPKDAWFKEIPPELKLNEADARHAIDSALKDYPLGAKQRAFVEWAIDRADRELYQGATGEERAAGRRAYDEMLAKPPPEPEGDVPFALPLKRKRSAQEEAVDDFVRANAGGDVSATRLRSILDGSGRWKTDSEFALVRLFLEQEQMMHDAQIAMLPEYAPHNPADRTGFAAERKAAKGWLDTFQDALRAGSSDAEAARLANQAHPEALRPARFLGGFDDPAFALGDDRPRDAAGLREWLRRFEGADPHYAVTSKGEVTKAARAVAEQFWEKEERTKASMQRAAREMLASKQGKAEVDAAIRGERSGDWREQSDLTVAAEMRVNSKLRAAANGATDVDGALDLAVDYYLLRSEQGRALSSVQRPRDARESFYTEAAKPSAEHAEELSSIAGQLKSADPETRAKLKQRVAEIKKAEARRFEQGMLALQKAGIDPETMDNTSLAAAHAYRIFALGTNKGFWNPILELRASAMISHPATTAAALGGNVLNVGWNTVLMRLAELPGSAVGMNGATTGEMRAMAAALPGAFNKAKNALWNVLRTDTPSYEAQLHDQGLIKSAQAFENAKLASIKGKKGRFVRIPLTAMTAVDEFARALGTELEAVGIAYRRAKGDTAKMAELLSKSPVWEEAVRRARRSIFQERDNNPLVELGFTAREGLDAMTGGHVPAGSLIFPFVQTGVNGLLEGLRKVPGPAQIHSLNKLRKGGWRDPEVRAQETARTLLSIALAGTAWGLANAQDEEGRYYITGTSTDSNDPPLSFQNGNGQWRSYAKMMPFSTVLATMVDAARAGVDFVKIGQSILKQGVDQTYFNSMAGILNAIESESPPDAKLARFGRDFAASFIPNVARGALTAFDDTQTVDPMRRHEGDDFRVLDNLRLRAGLDDPTVRYDNFGRPIEKGGFDLERYLVPMPPNRDVSNEHAADKVIRAWNQALPEGEKPWVPQKPRYWYEQNGETRYMSDPQYAEFQKRAGEIAANMLDESTLDPKNPTKAQIERIKRTLSKARARAKKGVLRTIPYDEDPE